MLRRLRRLVARSLPAVLLLLVAAGVRGVRRRRPAIERVNPDIRTPLLYVPLNLRSDRVRSLVSALPVPEIGLDPAVDCETVVIPDQSEPDLRALLYRHAGRDAPGPALLWLHGGGLVLGVPEQGHTLCSRWAKDLGLVVLSPDYRLAPDDPFPAGLEDCYRALCWLHDDAERLGVDADRIAVGGDSAGGGLAAALCQLARARGGPAIRFQLLEYPMLDDRTVLRSDHDGRGAFIWTPDSNRYGWTSYLGRAPVAASAPEHAAPARTEDLRGLPPAWIGVGDLDLFLDEDVEYARRLRDAGVAVDLHVEPGMYHAADAILPKAHTSRSFRDAMTDALAAGVAPE